MSDQERAVMQQALEALEACDAALAEELAAWDIDPPLHHVLEASNSCGPSITALRAALAQQPEPVQEPVAWRFQSAVGGWAYGSQPPLGSKYPVYPLYAAPPQPPAETEQGPVLVVEREPDYWSGGHFHGGRRPHIDPTKVWSLPIGTKLYTTPPQRPAGPVQEPVAKVELMMTGGNAGLATRIVEIEDHLRDRLRPGQLLYTDPPQRKPLTDEEIAEATAGVLGLPHEIKVELARAVERKVRGE